MALSGLSSADRLAADLGVGDLVVQQRVQPGGFGGGVAEAAAHGLRGDASVDELGGEGVAQLVDVDLDPGLRATLATSAAAAGRGRFFGALMVSMRSIGLASRRSWRAAHLVKEATAARLRLRLAGDSSASSARNARMGAADSAPISSEAKPLYWWARR